MDKLDLHHQLWVNSQRWAAAMLVASIRGGVNSRDIHVNDSCDNSAKSFTNLLSSSGLQQHIYGVTHKKGHTLDLLITRDVEPPVICDISITAGISDHSAILGKMQRPPVQTKVIRSRNIASIKLPLFCDDLVDVEVINPDCLNNSLYAKV